MDIEFPIIARMNDPCSSDDMCGYLEVCGGGKCVHKELWPLALTEILAAAFVFIVSAMANAAGITGCSMMIPVLIIIGGFTTHQTIPIVQLVAFSGVVMAVMYRFSLRHPHRDRPRIDFSLAMHLCMPMLLGTCYGVIVNAIMPDWIILILLTLALGFGAFGTFRKAVAIAAREASADAGTSDIKRALIPSDDTMSQELKDIFKEEARMLPIKETLIIVAMYIFTLLSAFARGGKGVKSIFGILPCSTEYWLFTFGFSVLCVGVICFTTWLLAKKYELYKKIDYPFEVDDMRWSLSNSNKIMLVALFTGLVCGMLGLTGGVFLGPALLMLDVKTEVANATCGFVVCFSSSVAFVQYAAAGMVNYTYGVWYASWAGVGALVGVALIESRMKASGKASPAVFILGSVLAMATILIPIYGGMRISDLVATNQFTFGFRKFC